MLTSATNSNNSYTLKLDLNSVAANNGATNPVAMNAVATNTVAANTVATNTVVSNTAKKAPPSSSGSIFSRMLTRSATIQVIDEEDDEEDGGGYP